MTRRAAQVSSPLSLQGKRTSEVLGGSRNLLNSLHAVQNKYIYVLIYIPRAMRVSSSTSTQSKCNQSLATSACVCKEALRKACASW